MDAAAARPAGTCRTEWSKDCDFRRGAFVGKTGEQKLLTTAPRPPRPGLPSDTFRSQAWFRHDGSAGGMVTPRMPMTPRVCWEDRSQESSRVTSPRSTLRGCRSEKALHAEAQAGSCSPFGSPRRNILQRNCSEGFLSARLDGGNQRRLAGSAQKVPGEGAGKSVEGIHRSARSPPVSSGLSLMQHNRDLRDIEASPRLLGSPFGMGARRTVGCVLPGSSPDTSASPKDAFGLPPRGRKVASGIYDESAAGRRIRQDESQTEAPRPQKRVDFPLASAQAPNGEGTPGMPPQHPPPARWPRQPSQEARRLVHQTSPEMERVMAHHYGGHDEVKYFLGDNVVNWQTQGRRVATACSQQDHNNSDLVRQNFGGGDHCQPQQPAILRSSVPVIYTANPVMRSTALVHSLGSSVLPSTTPKDCAYLRAGPTVVKHSPKRPGTFSPNVVRTLAREHLMSL